jgi:hypothetical protein
MCVCVCVYYCLVLGNIFFFNLPEGHRKRLQPKWPPPPLPRIHGLVTLVANRFDRIEETYPLVAPRRGLPLRATWGWRPPRRVSVAKRRVTVVVVVVAGGVVVADDLQPLGGRVHYLLERAARLVVVVVVVVGAAVVEPPLLVTAVVELVVVVVLVVE